MKKEQDFEKKHGQHHFWAGKDSEELPQVGGAVASSSEYVGNALLGAAYENNIRYVENLLHARNAPPVDFADEHTGMTALHIAVGRDHLPLAQFLVKRGAAFMPDKQGRMPSTVAAECEVSDEMCDFIAEAEAKAEGV